MSRMCVIHISELAVILAERSAGRSNERRTASIEIITSNSISVKPYECVLYDDVGASDLMLS